MGQYNVTTRQVLGLLGKGSSIRVYNACSSMPMRSVSITLSSYGMLLPAFGNLDWEVYYGGTWAGVPFESANTGGILQGSGTLIGVTELAHRVYMDDDLFPYNHVFNPNPSREYGLPIVLRLINNKLDTIDRINITFVTECSLTNVG